MQSATIDRTLPVHTVTVHGNGGRYVITNKDDYARDPYTLKPLSTGEWFAVKHSCPEMSASSPRSHYEDAYAWCRAHDALAHPVAPAATA